MSKDEIGKKGYTLVELTITIAIMAIITLVAICRIDVEPLEIKTEAKKLCSDIRYLRVLNMTENNLYEIVLTKDYYALQNGVKNIKRVYFQSDIELIDNFNDDSVEYSVLKFNRNGAPNFSGTIKIRNKNSGKYIEITIIPATGRVLLKDEIYSK